MTQSAEKSAAEYRKLLLDLEQKSIESFDKTLLTLSGGALGLSMTCPNNFVEPAREVQATWLTIAWFG